MELYHVMDVKDFFDEVCEKILFTNVDIRIIVRLIKINVINVDIVDGSMFIYYKFFLFFFRLLGNVFEWG